MQPLLRASLAAGAALVATLGLGAAPTLPDATARSVAPDRPDRPNVVLITTDDQTLADLRWLPETRRLIGAAGTTFTEFVAPQPLCCPSRAQLLTGQYAQNNGVRSNAGRRGGYPAFHPETALPVWLQDAGYTTGFVGKYLNRYPGTGGREVGWDSWDATVVNVYDYEGYVQYDGERRTRPAAYHTTYVADRSVDFVEEHADDDEPFFLWSSYVAPHAVCNQAGEGRCSGLPPAAEEHADLAVGRAPFRDDPAFNAPIRHGVERPIPGTGRVDPAERQRLFAARVRALASVDDAVTAIVDALDRRGVLDDTLLLFTSDNGYLFGEHRYTGKIVAYDQAVRVPLLARGPGVAVGARQDAPAAMIDLAPTIAAVAHAGPRLEVDGQSLVGALAGPLASYDRTLLVQAGVPGADRRDRGWMFQGVRTGRFTYVRWTVTGGVELFDRHRDPAELVNVARDPAYAAVRAELAFRTAYLADWPGSTAGPTSAPRRACGGDDEAHP